MRTYATMKDRGITGLFLFLEYFSDSVLSPGPQTFLKILIKCDLSLYCCPCSILVRRLLLLVASTIDHKTTLLFRGTKCPSAMLLSQKMRREQALSIITSPLEDCVIWSSPLLINVPPPTAHRLHKWKLRNNGAVLISSNYVSLFMSSCYLVSCPVFLTDNVLCPAPQTLLEILVKCNGVYVRKNIISIRGCQTLAFCAAYFFFVTKNAAATKTIDVFF